MALTTLAAVKAALDLTTTGDDARVTALIPQVQRLMEDEIGYLYDSVTGRTEYPLTRESSSVTLDVQPLTLLTSVHVSTDTPRVYDTTTALSLTSDVLWDARLRLLVRIDGGGFPAGPQVARVIYSAGAAAWPAHLERAGIMVIAAMLQKAKTKSYHVSGVNLGEGSITLLTRADVPDEARRIMELERRAYV